MGIQELVIKDSRLYSLEGNPVKAIPVGPPETIAGFTGDADVDKLLVDQLLEGVIAKYAPANAYVRGMVDKRNKTDPPYVPVQFYKLA